MTTTAVPTKNNGVYLIPPPPPASASVLPIADGKQPDTTNIGGITVGPATAAGQVFSVPAVRALGLVVRIRGNPTNNTATPAIVALLREDAVAGVGDPVGANTEIIYPVDNLSQLYIKLAAIGDAITISVRSS